MFVKKKHIDQFLSGQDRHLNYAYVSLTHRDIVQISDVMEDGAPLFSANLEACGLSLVNMKMLARAFAKVPTLVSLNLSHNNFSEENLGFLSHSLRNSQNILFASPSCPELESRCQRNRFQSRALLQKMLHQPQKLTKSDFYNIQRRLPSLYIWSVTQHQFTDEKFGQLLLNVKHAASGVGETIEYPTPFSYFLPNGAQPVKGMRKIDFSQVTSVTDLLDPEDQPKLYQAVRQGQLKELLSYLHGKGKTLDARMCLMQPTPEDPSVIDLISRQGQLALIMTAENWKGDLIGLRLITSKIPPKAIELQLRGNAYAVLQATVASVGLQNGLRPHRFKHQPKPD